MSLNHFTTEKAEKRVESIKKHLKNLQDAADFLNNLANHQYDCQEKTADLSTDTLHYFGCIMDMAVDAISGELGMLNYEGRPHAEAYVRAQAARGA